MKKLTVDVLSDERLQKSVDRQIFELAQKLYNEGRVNVVEVKDSYASCMLHDRHPYRVEIKVDRNYLFLKCNCRYAARGLICEHDIACCLAVRDVLQQRLPPTWRNQLARVLDTGQTKPRRVPATGYFLFFSLREEISYDGTGWKITPYHLPLSSLTKSGVHLEYPIDRNELYQAITANSAFSPYLRVPYQGLSIEQCLNCRAESVTIANLLLERSRGFNNDLFPLDEILTLIGASDCPLYYGTRDYPLEKKLRVISSPGAVRLVLNRDQQGLHITARLVFQERSFDLGQEISLDNIQVISRSPYWILLENDLLKIENGPAIDLLNQFLRTQEVFIPTRDENIFLSKYYLNLAEQYPLEGNIVRWETISSPPLARVYLTEEEGSIKAELRFAYRDFEIGYDPSYPPESFSAHSEDWTIYKIQRAVEYEQRAFENLTSPHYGLKKSPLSPKPGVLILRARVNPVDFLLHIIPRMIAEGFEVYGEDQLTTARVNRNTPSISFTVSSGIDWFDIHAIVHYGEIEVALREIRRAVRKKERYIKLPDGTIGEIPEDWLDQYRHLLNYGEDHDDGLRLSRHHLPIIDQAISASDQHKTDAEYLRQRQRLLEFSGINSKPLPDKFQGELRPYQKAGYDWLHFLHEYELGGCLADDMGLGKTIQTLVFFDSLREARYAQLRSAHRDEQSSEPDEQAASLIVVTRSLLVNWQREAARFTPHLRLLEYFDNNRLRDLRQFDQYDLVITTYGVMLRDIALFRKYTFHYAVLDESQAIKNPHSQTARAARLLQARHRLVLTGTPVENSSIELWSQFAFLNPGLLGSLEYFKNEFITPIEKKGSLQTTSILRKLVYPFILRRTKDQVAPELPPRTERILYSDMEAGQRKMYNRTRDLYRGIVLGMLEQQGLNQSRLKILEGLLRLRQISNHPRLVDDKFRGESGKFELLIETLETLRAENHKALVFSQFVQMLRLVRNVLDERSIPYTYLDGQTRNRMGIVDTFQGDPNIPFFLISLRAGGQGLNLTAADYVIHIDPWWNPAVETQASDRTHRIGQDKPVFIFKMITRDSVEEKILTLQERKKKLVDQLIQTENAFFKSLTEEDVQNLFS